MLAGPHIASVFASGTLYLWLEAAFRLLGTYTSLPNFFRLWGPRDGFIAAMWVSMVAISLVAYILLNYVVLRRRRSFGTLKTWMIIFFVSAILAPLIGEIGTPIGI